MDPDGLARLRAAIGRLERRLNTAARESGLTPTQTWVLAAIVRQGSVGVSELAASEGLNPTMLSRVVGKLADAGFIRRVPNPADGRAVLVEPTAAGRRLKQRIHQKRTAILAAQLTLLSSEQDDALCAALPALEALAADRSPSDRSPSDQSPSDQSPSDQSPSDRSPSDRSRASAGRRRS